MPTFGPEKITISTRDGQEDSLGGWSENGHDADGNRVGFVGGRSYDMGMSWVTTVPQGATITSATIRVFMKWRASGSGSSISVRLQGLDVDNVAPFAPTNRPSQHAQTTAFVDSTYDVSDYVDEAYLTLGDPKEIIQEIVNRPGFGGNIGVVLKDNGSPERWQFQDYGRQPANAAELTVVYTTTATSQIDGVAALTISGNALISAHGELTGLAPINLDGSASLIGHGRLDGTSQVVLGGSAALVGSGSISGQSALTITGSATGLGSGALAGESAYTFGATGTLTSIADGSMAGASDCTFSGSAILVGIGWLDGSSVIAIGGSAAVTGRGSLSGTSTYIFDATGTLLGVGGGSMIGESAYTIGALGQLIGSGILNGQSAVTFDGSAALTGTGSASGVSALTFGDAGTLIGSGSLVGQSALALNGSASLYGSGTLFGSSTITFGASLNPTLGIVPTAEGLEWSIHASKMHYNATGRLSYDVAGKVHYTVN